MNASQATAISALQVNQAAQAGQISYFQGAQAALAGRVDTLFSLRETDRKNTRQGIAAAVAIGSAPMPSGPGRTSYVLNAATFRGEQAIGGSMMHRLHIEDTAVAVTAGFSYPGNKNDAAKVGVAGEF